MNAWMRDKQRQLTTRRRCRPGIGPIVELPFDSDGRWQFDDDDPPLEIHVHGTGPSGETAIWLDDFFWLEVIRPFSQVPLTIHIEPTPSSLLHPVILHQLSMLRRIVPRWRLIGYCYQSDLASESRLRQAALSVHHEIRVIPGARPDGARRGTDASPASLDDVLEWIREIQTASKRNSPVVTCEADGEQAAVAQDPPAWSAA